MVAAHVVQAIRGLRWEAMVPKAMGTPRSTIRLRPLMVRVSCSGVRLKTAMIVIS